MKRRPLLVILFAVLLGVLGYLVWQGRNKSLNPDYHSSKADPLPPLAQTDSSNTTGALAQPAIPQTAVATSGDTKRTNEMLQAIEAKNSPVDFLAKVIDQNGSPVAEVRAEFGVRHWFLASTGSAQGKTLRFEKKSGSDGLLELHGVSGDGIDILRLQRQGYELGANATLHYPPASGNGDPLVIRMWKIGKSEPLVTGKKFFGIIPDGRIYTIDLLKGTRSESETDFGDLRVSIQRPEGVSRKDHFDWSFKITPVDGGIVETADDFMYLAPADGYSPSYAFQAAASDPEWRYRIKKHFYAKTRGERNYSRINVEVFALYDNGAVFDIQYAVNPSSSRNLQP